MDSAAKFVIVAGVAIVVLGAVLWVGARAGLGRMPGDIYVDRGNLKIIFPIVSSIILSILLTIALNVIVRLRH